jgi:VanZ family protein
LGKSATIRAIKYEIKGAVKSPFGFILMKTSFFKYAFLILSVLIAVFIFVMSHQTADVSSVQSCGVIESFAKIFVKDFDNLTPDSKQAIIDSYQLYIRKAAHFSVYAALSLFLCGYFVISDFFKKGYN